MVKCSNLSVKTRNKVLLENISFSVNRGEFCVILGKNGSGKTSLLRTLSGNFKFDGEISINSQSLKTMQAKNRAKQMAIMSQILPQPAISVRNLLAFGRQPYTGLSGTLSQKDWEIVDKTLKDCFLENLADAKVNLLSGGERRKAFFGMMLVQQAPLLLADEPCANLDVEYSRLILSMLKERKNFGDTILCILHDVNDALELADRILLLDCGKLVFNGKPEDFIRQNLAKKYFSLSPCTCIDENGKKNLIYR